ncbi:MAG: hypothetical protein NT007_00170 [Candidatus Kapabacteria bacterium]|nr:hypothetical protein [Candidatus Kapabacteria bacterium]
MRNKTYSSKLKFITICYALVQFVIILRSKNILDGLLIAFGISNSNQLSDFWSVVWSITQSSLITAFAYLMLIFYEKVFWKRVPSSNCRDGWFIYSLVAKNNKNQDKKIIGVFKLHHTINCAYIGESKVYHFENDKFTERGKFTSDMILLSNNQIRFVYNIDAKEVANGIVKSYTYIGYYHLDEKYGNAIIGEKVYEGYIQNISGNENIISGRIYSEKLKSKVKGLYDADGLLRDYAHSIFSKHTNQE